MKTLPFVALAALVLLSPLAAEARTTVERVQLRERGAFAEWQYVDEAGNTTFVSVLASEFARKPGDSAFAPVLAVSVFRVDVNNFVVFSGGGSTESFDFIIDPDLSTVQVLGTVPLFDEGSGTLVNFQVNIAFEATGSLALSRTANRFREPGFLSLFHFQGHTREAAATGTVFGVGIDFTPVPATTASIQRNDSGSMLVIIETPR